MLAHRPLVPFPPGDDHVPGDGYVTNVHFSLTGVEGTPPREICDFVHVKEWDFKVCNLEGNLPTYLGGNLSCLPVLEEWDFSRNHMTGALARLAAWGGVFKAGVAFTRPDQGGHTCVQSAGQHAKGHHCCRAP